MGTDEAQDDPSIKDDDVVWRRVPWISVTYKNGRPEAQSGAFNDSSDGTPMSVDIASLCTSARESMGICDGGLVELRVGDLREQGFGVLRHPEAGNRAHAYVTGKKSSGKRRRIARLAKWKIEPPPNSPERS